MARVCPPNLFHTIVGAEGVSINNVNLEHLSGVEKDKKTC